MHKNTYRIWNLRSYKLTVAFCVWKYWHIPVY